MGRRLWFQAHPLQVALALALAAGACSRTPEATDDDHSTSGDDTGNDDAGDALVQTLELTLGADALEPGESTDVTVRVTPAGVYPVQLALLEGASDAYVDDPALSTNDSGEAKTRLTVVAREGNALLLQARAGGKRARSRVTIQERSVSELAVVPLYTGNRAFNDWQVLVGPEHSCELTYDDPAWEAAATVERAFSPDLTNPEYTFDEVSSREPTTILVKAERFAMGCVTGVVLTPQTKNRVEVPINQRFADVSALNFAVQMNIAPDSEFWSSLLAPKDSTSYLVRLAANFRGPDDTDLAALLRSMGELSGTPEEFTRRRAEAGWDTTLTTNLSPEGAQSGLTSRVQRWLQDGAQLLQLPNAFSGQLRYHADDERGEFSLAGVAGRSPEDCVLPVSHLASIAVDAQDVLRVGFDVHFLPSALFGCLADAAVGTGSDAGVSDVLSGLAADFDCALVAQWMSDAEGQLYEGCDKSCGELLCRDALAKLWDRVVLSDFIESPLEVNAAGKATLTEDALVVGVEANWVGTTSFAGLDSSVSGVLRSCDPTTECQSMLR